LRERLYRRDPVLTVRPVIAVLKKEGYPTYYIWRMAKYLLNRGKVDPAGELLIAAKRFGKAHPLIDKEYGTWLWVRGERDAAMSFLEKSAKYWSCYSFLYSRLSAMNAAVGKDGAADKFMLIAIKLAKRDAVQVKPASRNAGTQKKKRNG
jgi:hypothetical protein